MDTPRSREFEQILRDGITAARSGQRRLAESLLNQAILLNGADARPYLWLSTTTDDRVEQIDLLERAVAVDPFNVAARRGLANLTGRVEPGEPSGEQADAAPRRPVGVVEAEPSSFLCPKCGGRTSFKIEHQRLECSYCGYAEIPGQDQPRPPSPAASEGVLEFVTPTRRGHRWAESQHHVACARCGAVSLLAPGERTTQCAYCGSNQIITSAETRELVDPEWAGVMQVDAKEARRRVKSWLGNGWLAPDNLVTAVRQVRLRPAYYSFWTFDGTLQVQWSCEVQVGSGRSARWEARSGEEMRFFDDVLVPGVKALDPAELKRIEPFNLEDLSTFSPELLAGWPALIYDRSLADASLLARETVMRSFRTTVHAAIEPGREKRNLYIGGGNWSGMTFKHILLPLWTGTYHYGGKEYHLLVNGQTGKVWGEKPVDRVKVVMSVLMLVVILLGLAAGLWWLLAAG